MGGFLAGDPDYHYECGAIVAFEIDHREIPKTQYAGESASTRIFNSPPMVSSRHRRSGRDWRLF